MITYGSTLAVYFQATNLEVMNGERWYEDARFAAANLADQYSLPLHSVAGVIAALSPSNRWERNLIDAENLCKLYTMGGDLDSLKVSTYNANKTKAIQILQNHAPLDILGGLKVRAFFECIMGADSVCVDGHAYAIWTGQRIPTTKTPKISPKLYAQISADYRTAAQQINKILGSNYSAAQIQAITWLVWRRIISEIKQ
jgi:hypothetical protein